MVGFATICIAQGEGASAELSALHVQPSHWGRGIGAALIAAARAQLVLAGCRAAHLWLLEGNVRAERFYRIDGWVPDGTRRAEIVWGADVVEIGFRRELP